MSTQTHNANLPNNIDRLIKERGLKQVAVAEAAGFSGKQLSDMLNGRKILKPCDVMAIADALGVTPNDLYGVRPAGKGA